MNDYAVHKALEIKGIDLEDCHFNFSQVNSPSGVPHNEEEFNKVIWMDHDSPPVTWAEVVSAGDKLDAEYDAQEYARNRKVEYDALNQLELMSDDSINGTTTHKDAIVAIKAKWPKDNSGPV